VLSAAHNTLSLLSLWSLPVCSVDGVNRDSQNLQCQSDDNSCLQGKVERLPRSSLEMPAPLPGMMQRQGTVLHGRSAVSMAAFSLGKSLLKAGHLEHGRSHPGAAR